MEEDIVLNSGVFYDGSTQKELDYIYSLYPNRDVIIHTIRPSVAHVTVSGQLNSREGNSMETNDINKVNFTKLEQEVMSIIRKYGNLDEGLENDLYNLIESVKKEQETNDQIKTLAFVLANKI